MLAGRGVPSAPQRAIPAQLESMPSPHHADFQGSVLVERLKRVHVRFVQRSDRGVRLVLLHFVEAPPRLGARAGHIHNLHASGLLTGSASAWLTSLQVAVKHLPLHASSVPAPWTQAGSRAPPPPLPRGAHTWPTSSAGLSKEARSKLSDCSTSTFTL